MARLILHATNVHQGGGATLLLEVIKELFKRYDDAVLNLDSRLKLTLSEVDQRINWVSPTIVHRLAAEWRLARMISEDDTILCFGNLPPLFNQKCRVVVLLQNKYIVDGTYLKYLPFRTRVRLHIERAWFFSRLSGVDEIIVQSPSMKALINKKTNIPTTLLPFDFSNGAYCRNNKSKIFFKLNEAKFDFVYIASGEAHKNHVNLLKAWRILAEQSIRPVLALTLNPKKFSSLSGWISELIDCYGLHVINLGEIRHEEVLELYGNARSLIYPSFFESMGLPLIEARRSGLSIVASELDFVRDFVDPEQTFDPNSPLSIARAVKRHMGVAEFPLPLVPVGDFLSHVTKSLI